MDLELLLHRLQEAEAIDGLREHWNESQACLPQGRPDFLDPDRVCEQRAFAGLDPALDRPLRSMAERVWASAELRTLAWHCRRLVFEHLDFPASRLQNLPRLQRTLGDSAGVFYFLIGLDAVPRTRAVHARRNVPERITRRCFSHFEESLALYAMHHAGRPGMNPGSLGWLRNHVKGDLFRLGRFEFMLKPFHGRLRAFRRRSDGTVLALAEDGVAFDAAGRIARHDAAPAWTARLQIERRGVTGCPISPKGHALNRTVFLPRSEWDPVLAPGDAILETHIPPGGGMTLERCRNSMAEALDFFPRTFPESPFVGFACYSWVLNPDLATIYRPSANPVLWQRELYLFPIPTGDREGLYFIFGENDPDPAAAPRDTSLRRALLDHLARGGRLIAGGMFFLTSDFPRFGQQPYTSSEPIP